MNQENNKTIPVEDLIALKSGLKGKFSDLKEEIEKIDGQIALLEGQKIKRQNELYRLQGENRLIDSLIPKDPEKKVEKTVEKPEEPVKTI